MIAKETWRMLSLLSILLSSRGKRRQLGTSNFQKFVTAFEKDLLRTGR